jgi:hypothetical protein
MPEQASARVGEAPDTQEAKRERLRRTRRVLGAMHDEQEPGEPAVA